MPTLEWVGKHKVVNHHHDIPYRVLEHTYGFSNGQVSDTPTDTWNMIIHWDNLEALKSLLPKYEGKIKCIYIDPPYNTGNEWWVYNDNVNDPKIKKRLHQVVGKEWEDLSRHDKRLCMMYPRLKLLHKLLRDDGVIFVSIDDNEQANLKLMMDDIFWAWNFVNTKPFIRHIPDGTNKWHIARSHEYILWYAKKINSLDYFNRPQELSWESIKHLTNAPWVKNPTSDILFKKWLRYEWEDQIITWRIWWDWEPIEVVWEMVLRGWELQNDVILRSSRRNKRQVELYMKWEVVIDEKWQAIEEIFLKKNWKPMYIKWLKYYAPKSVQQFKDSSESISLVKELWFDYPKPYTLVQFILALTTKGQDIILDSFAWSWTTAHAVLNLNKQDWWDRKFILVELMDYAETITAERVKRVITWYGEWSKSVEGTWWWFDYFELGEQLFLSDESINPHIWIAKLREYIWYTETRSSTALTTKSDNPYFLWSHNSTDYYFYYTPDRTTTLNFDFLATLVRTPSDQWIIYADICSLDEAFMREHSIIFKKIPRDISRF